MIKLFQKYFGRSRRLRPAIYVSGTLAGEPMSAQQIATAIQTKRGDSGVRGVIQVIEAYAAETLSMATNEKAIRDGMAVSYLMACSFLSNILVDLQSYAEGKVPAAPVKPAGARRTANHDDG